MGDPDPVDAMCNSVQLKQRRAGGLIADAAHSEPVRVLASRLLRPCGTGGFYCFFFYSLFFAPDGAEMQRRILDVPSKFAQTT